MLEVWILWVCIGGFVVFHALRALRDTRNIFAPPLILSLLVFTILVKPYFDFDDLALAVLLDINYYILTMSYALLSLLLFSLFYQYGLRSTMSPKSNNKLVDLIPTRIISVYVTVISIAGLGAHFVVAQQSGGLIAFYSASHGQAGDYSNISAYLYALPQFLWAALAISYVTLKRADRVPRYLLLLSAIIAAALFTHTLLFGNRDGVIRFAVMLGAIYVFINRPSFSRSLPLVGLLASAVVAVMVIGYLRHHLHLGSSVSLLDAIAEFISNRKEDEGKLGMEETGHELVFNVAVMKAVVTTGTHSFGVQYFYPIINFIPRFLWPGKPYSLDLGVNYFDLAEGVVGWRPIGGAAINSITESFLSFSWLGCMISGVFGYYCGRVVQSARRGPGLMNLGFLVACLMATVYWGTQTSIAVFYQWFFTIGPFLGLRILTILFRPMLLRQWATGYSARQDVRLAHERFAQRSRGGAKGGRLTHR